MSKEKKYMPKARKIIKEEITHTRAMFRATEAMKDGALPDTYAKGYFAATLDGLRTMETLLNRLHVASHAEARKAKSNP